MELGCVTGDVNLGTHIGRLTARKLGGLARYESDHKSERMGRKHEELALSGKISGGGSGPYGYEAGQAQASAGGGRDRAGVRAPLPRRRVVALDRR